MNSVEARHWLIVQCLSDNTLQLLFLSFDQSQKLVKSILLSLKYHSDIINNHRITYITKSEFVSFFMNYVFFINLKENVKR